MPIDERSKPKTAFTVSGRPITAMPIVGEGDNNPNEENVEAIRKYPEPKTPK